MLQEHPKPIVARLYRHHREIFRKRARKQNVGPDATFRASMALDTLSYARRLKSAGMPDAQAEAVAEATLDFVTAGAATTIDVADLKTDINALEQRLIYKMETLSRQLSVRMGGLVAVGVAILAAIIKP